MRWTGKTTTRIAQNGKARKLPGDAEKPHVSGTTFKFLGYFSFLVSPADRLWNLVCTV
jgi:hypothetical protein